MVILSLVSRAFCIERSWLRDGATAHNRPSLAYQSSENDTISYMVKLEQHLGIIRKIQYLPHRRGFMRYLSPALIIFLLPEYSLYSFFLNQKANRKYFFKHKSQGTFSRFEFHVKVFTNRRVHYKKTSISPAGVLEEWTGSLSETDYKTFKTEIIEICKFMDLPKKIAEPIRIKDSSFDEISVIFNTKKHSIGGYGASHYDKYKCVYRSCNKMLFFVKNQKFKVKSTIKF